MHMHMHVDDHYNLHHHPPTYTVSLFCLCVIDTVATCTLISATGFTSKSLNCTIWVEYPELHEHCGPLLSVFLEKVQKWGAWSAGGSQDISLLDGRASPPLTPPSPPSHPLTSIAMPCNGASNQPQWEFTCMCHVVLNGFSLALKLHQSESISGWVANVGSREVILWLEQQGRGREAFLRSSHKPPTTTIGKLLITCWDDILIVKKFSLTPTDTLKCIFETENNWFRLQYQILKYVWQGKGNIVWSLQSELLPLLSLWLFIVESNLHRRPVNLFWNCTHTQIAVFENFGCFKLHNLHTHWSQGSFHPSLHTFIICKCTVI